MATKTEDRCDNCKLPVSRCGALVQVPAYNTVRSEVEGWFCAECINEFEREGKIEVEV